MVPERIYQRVESRLARSGSCLLSPTKETKAGYALVQFSEKGKVQRVYVHRVIWEHAHGPIPEDRVVDHMCGNRACGNLAHLRLLTRGQNAARRNGQDWPIGTCSRGHDDKYRIMRKNGFNKQGIQRYRTVCGICRGAF